MKKNLVFIVAALSVSGILHAAVPVEDIGQRKSDPAGTVAERANSAAVAVAAPDVLPEPEPVASDSYSQLQLLREEVMQLRGLVEELSNEVQQLKQRQMDDYMDLDRRLSGSAAPAAPSKPNASTASSSAVSSNTGAQQAGEVQSYSEAYNLLKEGNVDSAVPAFKKHIENYPEGKYVANCYYWLGEVYLLKNDLEQARQSFTVVVDSYPGHRKVSDATFKLGKVYHLQGKADKAKLLLESVAQGNSSTAPLARKYLSDNF